MSRKRFFNSLRATIRVSKQDSAYVYFILESYEGICAYSTLNHENGDQTRDLELRYTSGFKNNVAEVLEALQDEVGLEILKMD